jgi:hypothetical protein
MLIRMGSNGGTRTPSSAESAASLADLLARASAAEQAALESDAASIRAELATLSRRLVALDRRLPATQRRLVQLRSLADLDLERHAERELGRILSLPGIGSAVVEHAALVVETQPLVVRDRALGRFQLEIALAGDIRVTSLDRRGPRGAWDHPHVQAGLPCLGNLREGILKLIAELELALAVQVLLDFLHTYQPETAYTPIEGWPPA